MSQRTGDDPAAAHVASGSMQPAAEPNNKHLGQHVRLPYWLKTQNQAGCRTAQHLQPDKDNETPAAAGPDRTFELENKSSTEVEASLRAATITETEENPQTENDNGTADTSPTDHTPAEQKNFYFSHMGSNFELKRPTSEYPQSI